MIDTLQAPRTIAVLSWRTGDGICDMLCHELEKLAYSPVQIRYGEPIPEATTLLLSLGPYGPLLPVWQEVARRRAGHRPVVVHWNTEGMPDPRLPGLSVRLLGGLSSRLGFKAQTASEQPDAPGWLRALSHSANGVRMARFRFFGDYAYAYRQGWLQILADTSTIYARRRTSLGVPTLYAPWGATATWWADLNMVRDIDVLWLGTRGSLRRSRLLDQIRAELESHGVRMHVADNVENPFIFKATRTKYLNRSKITLNLTRTWYDDNFSRFALAASNRSLIVSEPMLPHCSEFEAGTHYVSANIRQLATTILYYLQHENERQKIVEQAHQLVTTKLNFRHTLQRVLRASVSCAPGGTLDPPGGVAQPPSAVASGQADNHQATRVSFLPRRRRS
jgi:hypothetical protein